MATPEAAVQASNGPDLDPLSHYNTTNAFHHDLKVTLASSTRGAAGYGGEAATGADGTETTAYRRNLRHTFLATGDARLQPPAYLPSQREYNKLIDGAAAPHYQSLSHASHCPATSTAADAETAAAVATDASVAQAALRAKAHDLAVGRSIGGGHRSNEKPWVPTPDAPPLPPLSAAQRGTIGTKDPVRRENDWAGPAPWSSTHSASYNPVDPRVPAVAAAVAFSRREPRQPDGDDVLPHGALRNEVTHAGRPADGDEDWATEHRAQFSEYSTADVLRAERVRHIDQPGTAAPMVDLRTRSHGVAPNGEDINALMLRYPHRLTAVEEADLRRRDPVEWSVYRSLNPWQTSYDAMYDDRRGRGGVSLEGAIAARPDVAAAAEANAAAVEASLRAGGDGYVPVAGLLSSLAEGAGCSAGGYLVNEVRFPPPAPHPEADDRSEYKVSYRKHQLPAIGERSSATAAATHAAVVGSRIGRAGGEGAAAASGFASGFGMHPHVVATQRYLRA
eukprot:TRINITY_DN33126_c0_g1_i1.p1 TRINITY_DN33126_c0_g1~~TRINITY_DN33126_c0_g1_i1.p1  ORF type:complete len:556 (-),score=76.40 TRINITY_DN33126_c0_g1_i1:235-1752(-)